MVDKCKWVVHVTIGIEVEAHTQGAAEQVAELQLGVTGGPQVTRLVVKSRAKPVRPSRFEELPEYVQQMCNDRVMHAVGAYRRQNETVRAIDAENEGKVGTL